jgi:hypothetical protein
VDDEPKSMSNSHTGKIDADSKSQSFQEDSYLSDSKIDNDQLADSYAASMKANYDEDEVYDEDFEEYDDDVDIQDPDTKDSDPSIENTQLAPSIFEASIKQPLDENSDNVLIDENDINSTIDTDQEVDVSRSLS